MSVLFDDFISAQTNGNGGIGNLNIWKPNTSGSGSNYNVGFAPDDGHPGTIQFVTGTSTSGLAGIITLNNSNQNLVQLGGGAITVIFVVKLEQLSNVTDTFFVMAGMANGNSTSSPANGVYFSYSNAGSTPNWFINTSFGASATSVSSGVAATTAWTTLRFDINAAGTSVTFSINGTAVGTITTNIPTDPTGFQSYILKTAGTTSCNFDIDMFYFFQSLTSAR